jgi:hypothetical protein
VLEHSGVALVPEVRTVGFGPHGPSTSTSTSTGDRDS